MNVVRLYGRANVGLLVSVNCIDADSCKSFALGAKSV